MEKVIKEVIKLTEAKCKFEKKYELTHEIANGLQEELIKQKEAFAKYFIREEYCKRINEDGEYEEIPKYKKVLFVDVGGDIETLLRIHKQMYEEEKSEADDEEI